MTRIGSLEVSRIGLGCMGMSGAYGSADQAEALRALARAVELGYTFFDTADIYGRGANETLIGPALAPHRDRIVLATKAGLTTNRLGLPNGTNGRPEHIRRALDASLSRLGTDRVDLYYLHRVDPDVPVEESFGAMAEAVAAGKVRELGISEATPDQIRRAHAVHPLAALQSEWSLFAREIEGGPLAAAREVGAAVVPYSPLGRGMLAGPARLGLLDYRRFLPWWSRANREQNLASVEVVRGIALRHGATAGQVALAWVLAQGDDVIPIPGTKRETYVEENWAAAGLTLTAEDLAALDALRAAGARKATRGQT